MIARWTIAVGFFIESNCFFGWHKFPQSDAELIADGIVFILSALALRGKSDS